LQGMLGLLRLDSMKEPMWVASEFVFVFGQWPLHERSINRWAELTAFMGVPLVAAIELMRPKNVLLAICTIPLGAYFASDFSITQDQMMVVVLHMFSVAFFMGAGNGMNDIKDHEIDRFAHPQRPIPSNRIHLDTAKWVVRGYWMLSIISLSLGIWLHPHDVTSMIVVLSIYVSAVVMMITYDHGPSTKNRGFLGNIVISLMVGLVIIYGGASIGRAWAGILWWIFGVVFLTNLSRELVKDCMDMNADMDTRSTVPMRVGVMKTRMFAYVCVMGALICLYVPFWKGPFEFGQLFLQVPAILALITLNGPMMKGNDERSAQQIRVAMI